MIQKLEMERISVVGMAKTPDLVSDVVIEPLPDTVISLCISESSFKDFKHNGDEETQPAAIYIPLGAEFELGIDDTCFDKLDKDMVVVDFHNCTCGR